MSIIHAYFDNNATTRPHPEVLAAIRHYSEEMYLNAASAAGDLMGAGRPLGEARAAMLELLGAAEGADRIALTSGASEANAWVFGALDYGDHALVGSTEHSSVLAAAGAARTRGANVGVLPTDADGLIERQALRDRLRPDTRLVSIQLANNETGVIQPLATLATIIRDVSPAAMIHTDATQAVGRIPIDFGGEFAEIDLLSFSAHKFHGPKGIGGLLLRERISLRPLIPGEQENGLRGGTSNTPAAAGLAVAARRARADLDEMTVVSSLCRRVEDALTALYPGAFVHGSNAPRLPNTSSIAFPTQVADDLVETLALEGVCVAAGSACTASAIAPSHVLVAMGVTADDARATLRISLSVNSSETEVELLLAAIARLFDEACPAVAAR